MCLQAKRCGCRSDGQALSRPVPTVQQPPPTPTLHTCITQTGISSLLSFNAICIVLSRLLDGLQSPLVGFWALRSPVFATWQSGTKSATCVPLNHDLHRSLQALADLCPTVRVFVCEPLTMIRDIPLLPRGLLQHNCPLVFHKRLWYRHVSLPCRLSA